MFAKFTGEHLYQSLFFKNLFKKKRLWHRCFSCEFCEILKNTYFEEHLRTAAPNVAGMEIKVSIGSYLLPKMVFFHRKVKHL